MQHEDADALAVRVPALRFVVGKESGIAFATNM